jgi:hypothetical protein
VMWYKCLFTEGWLYRGTRHAGVPFVGELRGGFTGYRLCRRPLQDSMTRWLDDRMSAGGLQATGLGWGWLAGLGWGWLAGLARMLTVIRLQLLPL